MDSIWQMPHKQNEASKNQYSNVPPNSDDSSKSRDFQAHPRPETEMNKTMSRQPWERLHHLNSHLVSRLHSRDVKQALWVKIIVIDEYRPPKGAIRRLFIRNRDTQQNFFLLNWISKPTIHRKRPTSAQYPLVLIGDHITRSLSAINLINQSSAHPAE